MQVKCDERGYKYDKREKSGIIGHYLLLINQSFGDFKMAKRGRPKGSSNKPYRRVLDEYLQRKYKGEFNPVINAIESALKIQEIAESTGEIADYKASVDAFDRVSKYIQPTLKAVEMTGDTGVTVSLQRKRFDGLQNDNPENEE